MDKKILLLVTERERAIIASGLSQEAGYSGGVVASGKIKQDVMALRDRILNSEASDRVFILTYCHDGVDGEERYMAVYMSREAMQDTIIDYLDTQVTGDEDLPDAARDAFSDLPTYQAKVAAWKDLYPTNIFDDDLIDLGPGSGLMITEVKIGG